MLALSCFMLSSLLVSIVWQRHDHEVQVVILDTPLPRKNAVPKDTTELIEKLAATTRRAASGRNMSGMAPGAPVRQPRRNLRAVLLKEDHPRPRARHPNESQVERGAERVRKPDVPSPRPRTGTRNQNHDSSATQSKRSTRKSSGSTDLLRTRMLPCDPVWGSVKKVHDAHFRHSDHRVGIQERYFNGKANFELLHGVTEENIAKCLISNGFLPNPNPRKIPLFQKLSLSSPPLLSRLNVTTIFITSLYQELHKRLSRDHERVALETGDALGLVQLSHENKQSFGVEVDRQALTEILCLSLTEHLVLTPQSTFGAVAQGYGGLVLWFMELRAHTATPCVRAQSREACYQVPATKKFTCRHDVGVNGKLMTDVVPYLADCHLVEKP